MFSRAPWSSRKKTQPAEPAAAAAAAAITRSGAPAAAPAVPPKAKQQQPKQPQPKQTAANKALPRPQPQDETSDPHVQALARGLRVPLTFWLVGYSTISMLPSPSALKRRSVAAAYTPGILVRGLTYGDLANTPLLLLSGIAAGNELAEATPEGQHIPGTWALLKFWGTKVAAVLPPIVSVLASVVVSSWSSNGGSAAKHVSRVSHMYGAAIDCLFYLAAPTAFRMLRTADRGASPRLVVMAAAAATAASFIAATRVGATATAVAAVPVRFPAFFAGLALAVERARPESKGPSARNQAIGVAVGVGLSAAVLVAPSYLGSASTDSVQLFNAFKFPAAALATYLFLRPLVAVPPEESLKSPWRAKLYSVLMHPTFETVSSVIFAAEMVHKEVIRAVFYIAKVDADSATSLNDVKVLGLWGVVVVSSVGVGYAIHRVLQVPSMKVAKRFFDKKRS